MPSPRESSVKQLSEFYNVVTGFALALAITNLVDASATLIPVKGEILFNFGTFLLILLPFHQGAVRHLFARYVENGGGPEVKRGALALDFLILFLEACIFVLLAAVISKTNLFASVVIALFAIDCIWAFLVTISSVGQTENAAEWKWSLINLITVFILVTLYIFGPRLTGGWDWEMKLLLFIVCFVRTSLDYFFSWDFYYPTDNRGRP